MVFSDNVLFFSLLSAVNSLPGPTSLLLAKLSTMGRRAIL